MIITAVFIIGFSSCQKEGVYKPKEKIASIYRADSYNDKYLSEKWTWDGKKLETIEHFYVNHIGELKLDYTENFKYDSKNRIEKVECTGIDEYTQYKYDGNKLERIEHYGGNNLLQSAIVHYDGKKIGKIEYYVYEYDKNNTQKMCLLPKRVMDEIMSSAEKSKYQKSATMYVITLELNWDGDNVTKSKTYYTANYEDAYYDENTYEYIYNRYNTYYESVTTYSYDDKTNPLYGFRNMDFAYSYDSEMFGSFSKNNAVSTVSIGTNKVTINGNLAYDNTSTITTNCLITYDGKVPTEIITSNSNNTTSTIFYEYK